MSAKPKQKDLDAVEPSLEPGEEILSALFASPKGNHMQIGTRFLMGNRDMRAANNAGKATGLELSRFMMVVLTNKRLLTFGRTGMGKIKEPRGRRADRRGHVDHPQEVPGSAEHHDRGRR